MHSSIGSSKQIEKHVECISHVTIVAARKLIFFLWLLTTRWSHVDRFQVFILRHTGSGLVSQNEGRKKLVNVFFSYLNSWWYTRMTVVFWAVMLLFDFASGTYLWYLKWYFRYFLQQQITTNLCKHVWIVTVIHVASEHSSNWLFLCVFFYLY